MPRAEPLSSPAAPAGAVPLAALLSAVPAPAYTCDAEGRITGFNELAASLWERRPALNDSTERFCGSSALLAPDGTPLPHDSSPMARALADGRPQHACELVIVRPEGRRRIVLCYVTPAHDASGNVLGAMAVLVDVTEREEAQRAARAALIDTEASFRGFFDTVAVGAVQVNAEGRITAVNDRYCEITGYSREELLTMTPLDLDPPEDRQADLERVLKSLADPSGMYHAEKRYLRKDGTYRWVHVAANVLRDSSGRPMQTAAIVLDISERKRAEEALQQADRLKDDFIATLAHELRNPLSPLTSAAELLRQCDAHDREWCRAVIDRQVTHLARLIDDLLDVSRITRDKLELRRERIELGDVIGDAVEASRSLLKQCEQKLTVKLTDEPVLLDGDPVRLTQVFTNLLTNAAKFTERAGAIRVQATARDTTVEVRVEDSGVGIEPEELSRIFEKFYQSPGRGSRLVGGLGVGLSLVKRLVELHGGSIEARSRGTGSGSEFIVRLPCAAAGRGAADSARAPVQTPDTHERAAEPASNVARALDAVPASDAGPERAAVQPQPARSRRLLVVDDNVDSAEALARLLRAMGHDAVAEYDGQSALQRAASFAPDIALLDLGMPGTDGFDVCRHLRGMPSAPAKVVALTGWGRKVDIDRTKQAGFDAHLVKPVSRSVLERLLAEH